MAKVNRSQKRTLTERNKSYFMSTSEIEANATRSGSFQALDLAVFSKCESATKTSGRWEDFAISKKRFCILKDVTRLKAAILLVDRTFCAHSLNRRNLLRRAMATI